MSIRAKARNYRRGVRRKQHRKWSREHRWPITSYRFRAIHPPMMYNSLATYDEVRAPRG